MQRDNPEICGVGKYHENFSDSGFSWSDWNAAFKGQRGCV